MRPTALAAVAGGQAAGWLLAERLTTGRLLAVDRSRVAVERTAARNAAHLASGRLTVRQGALAELDPAPQSLDRAFAINVNLFWVARPDRELAVLHRALRPDGTVHILYGAAGPTGADRITDAVSTALREHGFTDVTTTTAAAGIGVSARR